MYALAVAIDVHVVGGDAVGRRLPVGGQATELVVERPVFLHHHNDVVDRDAPDRSHPEPCTRLTVKPANIMSSAPR
jgi:hypothetical protein